MADRTGTQNDDAEVFRHVDMALSDLGSYRELADVVEVAAEASRIPGQDLLKVRTADSPVLLRVRTPSRLLFI